MTSGFHLCPEHGLMLFEFRDGVLVDCVCGTCGRRLSDRKKKR